MRNSLLLFARFSNERGRKKEMTTRYDDRNYDRNYDRDDDDSSRSRSEYGRSYSGKSEGRYRSDESDRESGRYGREGEYEQGDWGELKGKNAKRGGGGRDG